VAFFFLFFLHGTSIGNGQQGISYNKEVNPNPELENIRLSRNHINELLSYISSIQQEIAERGQQKLEI